MKNRISNSDSNAPLGPRYWRGLDELAETREFREWVANEFPGGASELTADPVTRRHFMKIMSASFLFAGLGLTGCRRPEHKILPFGDMPEFYVHGVPKYYATSLPTRTGAIPLVVEANDGRPTKVEGNALHPSSNGGTDHFAQASILNLYDPDRAMAFKNQGDEVANEAAFRHLASVAEKLAANQGEGLRILAEGSTSPSRLRLQRQLQQNYPNAKWHQFDPIDFDVDRRAASALFGKAVRPYYKFDQAQVVLSLDSDFLGMEEDLPRHTAGFARLRKMEKPSDGLNRLYVVEALMTVTGANADHRLRVAPSSIPQIASQFAGLLLEEITVREEFTNEWISECARDLQAHAGKCLVVAGHRQPAEVHQLAHAINAVLGNAGQTVEYLPVEVPEVSGLAELIQDLNRGVVETLVILDGNPAYTVPPHLGWAEAAGQAGEIIRVGYYEDETYEQSTWHFPAAHYLESWGDARTSDGTWVPVQPLIAPLFNGVTELEVLARLLGSSTTDPYDIVRETLKAKAEGLFEAVWGKFLHDGYLAESAQQPVEVKPGLEATKKAAANIASPANPSAGRLDVVVHRSYSLDDGRYNNNGWLQELADPITKITWENVIQISPATAKEAGVHYVDDEDMHLMVPWAKLEANGRSIEGPVWIQPGLADNTVAVALGYGRTRTGRVGKGSGHNAYPLRTTASSHLATGAKLTHTGRDYELACVQAHWAMEGRPVIREANLQQFREKPDFVKGMDLPHPPSTQPLYPNPLDWRQEKAVHQWGMVIDLNSCTGCNACVIACQSENNVPIVGKDQVRRSREMHWLRIDRYFAGDAEDPQVVNQPMLCQHCEAAPCENVCPVNATVHDAQGLNLMVYNRCVGTRYCSNNCPYKVRRFNFFDYNRRPLDELYKTPILSQTDGEWELKRWIKNPSKGSLPEGEWQLSKMVSNPDVSVRMRGVMEKCTFCIQRIEQAKIAQKVKAGASGEVEIPDGKVKTACQQACPAEAIHFGNVADPDSNVSKQKEQARNYTVLEFLATKPRLTYLARVRNPNPAMPDYRETPLTVQEYTQAHGNPFETHHGSHDGNGHGSSASGSHDGHPTESSNGKGAH